MKLFHKIISWLSTAIFVLVFFSILCFFHVVQLLAFRLGGYLAHKNAVDYMVFCLMKALYFTGASLPNLKKPNLPTDRPLLVVSNHQNMYDIPAITWAFRKHHVKFVSKKELAKGIPAISFNLRHGGAVLIDRKDRVQALKTMSKFGKYIESNNYAACIFPEGTRSRDGNLKEFKVAGIQTLLKTMKGNPPLVVPVVVNNFWKIQRYNFKPIPFGINFSMKILDPIDFKIWIEEGKDPVSLVSEIQKRIQEELDKMRED